MELFLHGDYDNFRFLTNLQSGDTKYSLFAGSCSNISDIFSCDEHSWPIDHLGIGFNI